MIPLLCVRRRMTTMFLRVQFTGRCFGMMSNKPTFYFLLCDDAYTEGPVWSVSLEDLQAQFGAVHAFRSSPAQQSGHVHKLTSTRT